MPKNLIFWHKIAYKKNLGFFFKNRALSLFYPPDCNIVNNYIFITSLMQRKGYDWLLDVRLIECEQYPRRENIVISGIPEFVTHDHLKEQVVTICYNLGLDITEHDIAACHRLPKGEHSRWPANTIVRFYSRDHVASCLKNSYKLKSSRFKRETEMNWDGSKEQWVSSNFEMVVGARSNFFILFA